MKTVFRILSLLAAILLAAGCGGPQSALSGDGPEAARTLLLTWIMFAGGAAILLLVSIAMVVAIRGPERWRRALRHERMVFYGGVIFPAVVLTVLLFYGFAVMRIGAGLAADEDALRVSIVGEQWWWRVIYENADGETFETANELRIPVGQTVAITLTSADVIHSFWVPAYAGKLDMVPGRTNTLHIKADVPGLVRGQCAEYCGGAHALMSFFVEAMTEADFAEWLESEQARAVSTDETGARLFNATGCGGCHTVRGDGAQGVIGPNLTHVASRHSLAAATLKNDAAAFRRWLRMHQSIKPDNRMPKFDFLSDEDIETLASYLESLE